MTVIILTKTSYIEFEIGEFEEFSVLNQRTREAPLFIPSKYK